MEAVMHGAPCPLLMLPPGAAIRPPFVVIYDGSPASARALRLTAQLAKTEGQGVTVLLAAVDPPMARRLRPEADALLAVAKVTAQYPLPPRPEVTAIARAVRAASAGTLLMAADSLVFNGNARRRLLEELECAALLTR
jgi:nucleotide-binding universal stress UspA family protein